MFLKDQFTPRESTGNLVSASPTDSFAFETEEEIEISLPPSYCTNFNKTKVGPSKKHRKKDYIQTEDNIGSELIKLEQQKLKFLESDTPNEDQSFFDSLLPHVKKIIGEKKLLFRMDIQRTVYKYVYEKKEVDTNDEDSFQYEWLE